MSALFSDDFIDALRKRVSLKGVLRRGKWT